MDTEKTIISEEELEEVAGGRTVRHRPAELRGTNNICPKCGKIIEQYSSFDIEGSPEAEQVYMCPDCNLSWLRRTSAADILNYTLVTADFNENGKKTLIGPYQK